MDTNSQFKNEYGTNGTSEDLTSYVKLIGTLTCDNKECWKIEINDVDYKIIDYTVQLGETSVWAIGKKLAISEYKIKELTDIGDIVHPQTQNPIILCQENYLIY